IGYWLGSTPVKQESFKFLGTLVSAATVGAVIFILNDTYGFSTDSPNPLAAPQANAMVAVIHPLMSKGANISWMLYIVGAVLALLLNAMGISPLAFALGMYLPLELNTPLLVGGLVAWYVRSRSKDEKLNDARTSRGTLIASGFLAGGALFGVFGAMMKFVGFDFFNAAWHTTSYAETLAIAMFLALVVYTIWDSLRAKIED
ncbi:MAG: OPT/YSL family transporter, partial [Bacteroidales bacterium]|nr:OPT/YSL family transporter [Bacteroidales bacterium]